MLSVVPKHRTIRALNTPSIQCFWFAPSPVVAVVSIHNRVLGVEFSSSGIVLCALISILDIARFAGISSPDIGIASTDWVAGRRQQQPCWHWR
jgi:hypothetical protein